MRVANIWNHHRSDSEVRVYIGRACRGYDQSPLANPFRDEEREQVIAQYREWLRQRLKDHSSPQRAEIIRLAQLVLEGKDVVLLCWCAPKPCHGDIVQEAVLKLCGLFTSFNHKNSGTTGEDNGCQGSSTSDVPQIPHDDS